MVLRSVRILIIIELYRFPGVKMVIKVNVCKVIIGVHRCSYNKFIEMADIEGKR